MWILTGFDMIMESDDEKEGRNLRSGGYEIPE